MRKKRRRGRPATGHDPVAGVRIPAKVLKKIDRLAEVLSMERSAAVRRLIDNGLDWDRHLLRTGKGKGVTGGIVSMYAELEKAAAAKADEMSSALADRMALQGANKTPPPNSPRQPAAPIHEPEHGPRRHLSDAEIKSAADRAEAGVAKSR